MTRPFQQAVNDVLALYRAGRLAAAEASARTLVADFPDAAAAYNVLGVIQADLTHAAEAEVTFRKAITLDRGSDESHYNLGLMLCEREDFDAAVDSFRAALRLRPGNAAAIINLGAALHKRGALGEAAANYRLAIAAGGPELARAHCNLGAVLSDMGEPGQALACFQRALALQPNYGDAHLNIGRALRRLGRLDEAVASLRRAVDCAPASADARILYADALRDLGRLDEAVLAYGAALEVKPNNRQVLYHLGLTQLDLGRSRDGLSTIARGPGIAHINLDAAAPANPGVAAVKRIDLMPGKGPTFIGGWTLAAPDVCDDLIAFFERHPELQNEGRTGLGVDTSAKNSTDLTISPADIGKPGYEPVAAYLGQLEACYRDYARQWPHLARMLPRIDMVPFTIQRYRQGGHFQRPHSERMSFGFIHRVLAWMTYLNDVDGGGETRFHHFDLNVRPERGKTLIWPAEWTHVHAGEVVTAGTKYIITGWMHFPHDAHA